MSRTERNARREAEKRKTARRLRIRDCAVIFACLVFMFAYISALSTITSEPEFIPEYVFAGNTSKNVPVYLIGIPIEEEEAADEKGNGQKEETSQETAEENGEETAEEVAAEGQDSRTVKAVKVGKLVRGSSVKKLLGYQEVDGVVYCKVGNTGLDETADLYITSYDLLKRDITAYDGLYFSSVILDEAQYIKNHKTAIAKAVKILQADHRFALTGTPIENRLSELWSIFDFLMPGFLYTSSEFAERFEAPIMKKKDPAATARLSRMTEPFILRRKKTDVLKDLPEKLEEVHTSLMEDDQRKLYDAHVVHMKEILSSSGNSGEDKMRVLAEITRLRQLCCDPSLLFEDYKGSSTKRAACLELIQNAIDGGHRMLVFSQFTSMLSLLAEDLKQAKIPFYTITGSTPKQERIRLVGEFNSREDVPVFLISLKAGGTGLNLIGADVVIHYDPWWNLAVQNQATDRAHRIGQTHQVTVIKLITAKTIEEKIMELQEAKRDLADAIMEGQSNSLMSMTKEELLALLT